LAVFDERERLARELHDAVTQSLYSLSLLAEAARERADKGELDPMKGYLDEMSFAAVSALKEIRLLLYELRPVDLSEVGLVEALRRRVNAVERRAGLEARIVTGALDTLPPRVEEALYRIAQEALNNSLKHAAASSVSVHLRTEGEGIVLLVQDDGRGFDLAKAEDQGGMGLSNMRERATELGGDLKIVTRPGQATTVTAWVPVRHAERSVDAALGST
jgi:signal transduction histidine kinase